MYNKIFHQQIVSDSSGQVTSHWFCHVSNTCRINNCPVGLLWVNTCKVLRTVSQCLVSPQQCTFYILLLTFRVVEKGSSSTRGVRTLSALGCLWQVRGQGSSSRTGRDTHSEREMWWGKGMREHSRENNFWPREVLGYWLPSRFLCSSHLLAWSVDCCAFPKHRCILDSVWFAAPSFSEQTMCPPSFSSVLCP